uniref:Uncharacterized protein n=1 Tax=Arundo donax TaxID=35708 RepID=A0A0A9A6K4_ARUDO
MRPDGGKTSGQRRERTDCCCLDRRTAERPSKGANGARPRWLREEGGGASLRRPPGLDSDGGGARPRWLWEEGGGAGLRRRPGLDSDGGSPSPKLLCGSAV